jgi:RNA polymerase sigma factor (sigma-70 family)
VETLPAAEAVEQLIHEYGKLVFHVVFGLVGDWHESEDLTQDTFLQALRAIDAARAASGTNFQPKAWLLRIAVNIVKMHRRRCRLVQFVPFSQLATEEAGLDGITEAAAPVQPGGYGTTEGGGDPATLLAERDAVGRALAGLPDPRRVPLLLSVVGGFSSAEIARILGIGEAAIRQRLSRARRQFKERYAAECGEVVRDPVATAEHQRVCSAPGGSPRLAVSRRWAPVTARS